MYKVDFCKSEFYFFVNVVNQRMFIVHFLSTHHSASFVLCRIWAFRFTYQLHSNVDIPRIVSEFIQGSNNVLISGLIQWKSTLELGHLEMQNCAVSMGSLKLVTHLLGIGGLIQEIDLTHRGWDFPLNPEAGSLAQERKSRLGHRKAFLLSFLHTQLSSCSQTSVLMSVPFFIQSWSSTASAVSGASHSNPDDGQREENEVHVVRG